MIFRELPLTHRFVTDGPVFKVKPQNAEADAGATVTLSCVVDGHPVPKVSWLRYENNRFIVCISCIHLEGLTLSLYLSNSSFTA